ncbi:MAG TPA: hypothetical protein VK538_12460 [Solirubrobacteraceae bacterium]|nr:hypothetical protein [Solirubrobacteraceae bacterium]
MAVDRGIPTPEPTGSPRGSGVGRLKDTVRPSGKAQPNAIPAADEAVIKGMEQAGQEGVQAGAVGEAPKHPPGSQRDNLPPEVRNLIADSSINVP